METQRLLFFLPRFQKQPLVPLRTDTLTGVSSSFNSPVALIFTLIIFFFYMTFNKYIYTCLT